MHIIRLDIDRKNSAEHLQVGPLGSGLNAIFAPIQAGGESMNRFIRSMLFRGYASDNPTTDEYTDTTDGSLQWVDASGHVRMMTYAGGSPILPSKFVHSPLHPSERPLHADDREQIRGLGNIFWEGDDQDGRWDDLRGDILGMIFCSPLGSVSPEKLWWAASRLGVHAVAKSQPDEGYQRLKAEEQELLERLRNVESVDHDRAWWSIERDRVAAELNHVIQINLHHTPYVPAAREAASTQPLRERLITLQYEIARLRNLHQEAVVNEANSKLDLHQGDEYRTPSASTYFSNVSMNKSIHGNGVHTDYAAERLRLQSRIEGLLAEQAAVEAELQGQKPTMAPVSEPTKRWDDTQLRQQLAHAEEMIRRWDRRSQTHRRLAEVQSHLRTRSPFRRTTEGSLIPTAEKFLRELTSGAARQLPPWAIESSYLNSYSSSIDGGLLHETGYRQEYYDRTVPSPNTRQRKLVDLAIRLAIAQASVPRIGRIPLLLDDTISGFRGESLEQILHVLATFARDGRQLLISTSDEYTARRIAAHGGTVSRMQEILRYARPSFVLDGQTELGLHPSLENSSIVSPVGDIRPLRVVGAETPHYELGELNKQLAGWANEQAIQSWWYPERAYAPAPRYVESNHRPPQSKRHFLYVDSPVHEAPGIDTELTRRLHAVGVYRVGDLLRSSASQLGASVRVDAGFIEHAQRVAQLMCETPQLRAFDAQVLVGCGFTRASALKDYAASDIIARVEDFLSSVAGQDLVRSATPFEVSRIHGWIADMKRNLHRRGNAYADSDYSTTRTRNRSPRDSRRYESMPRIARTRDDVRIRESREPRETVARTSSSNARTNSARTSTPRPVVAPSPVAVTTNSHWKFYLDVDSPVVDAPSIGPKMAERLAPVNIHTVGDLLGAQPSAVATALAEKNVHAETIIQWQQQAMLVCRIPNLRGHDAQLLVGSGFVTAEQVASSDKATLYESVARFAATKAGVRILRGAASPDIAEVADWIQWAQNCRAVRAA